MRPHVPFRTGVLLLILTLIAQFSPWIPAALARSGDPSSWGCSSAQLGLDQNTVQYAPVSGKEHESDGSRIVPRAARGTWVPVIMVHGWTGRSSHPNADGTDATQGAFSHLIDLTANKVGKAETPRSLIGQLQGLPGAAVFTFDYHPYSGRWVTDSHLGPALGKVVDCLAKASGQKVIIVGHSMGGLIARYAAAHPNRSSVISRIITLGTPNTGSLAAYLANAALTVGSGLSRAVATVRLVLAACGQVTTARMSADGLCSLLLPFLAAFDGQAGRALRFGSPELKQLANVPTGITVNAVAGDISFQLPLSWFGLGQSKDPVEVGDLIVPLSSALNRSVDSKTVSCTYQLSATRGTTQTIGLLVGLVTRNDVASAPWKSFSGPCFHTQLMRSIELTNEVMGLVNDDINPSLTNQQLANTQIPAHSCGTSQQGWDSEDPIPLKRGAGTARNPDGSYAGVTILDSSVMGRADFTDDGTEEVVLRLHCSGSEPERCCAGRTSLANFVVLFEVDRKGKLRRLGKPIMGGKSGPEGRQISSAKLSGKTVVTKEYIVYPEGHTNAELGGDPYRTITAKYVLRNGEWVEIR